jgi:hypothetical protein
MYTQNKKPHAAMFGEYLDTVTLVLSFFLGLAFFFWNRKSKRVVIKFPNTDSNISDTLNDAKGCYQLTRTYLPCDATAAPHP